MKVSAKKRRSKALIKEDKKLQENAEAAMAAKLKAIKELEERLAEMETKVQQTDEIASQIHGFFNEGVLENDANGRVKVADSFIQRGVEMS